MTTSSVGVAGVIGTPYSQTQSNTGEALGHTNHLQAGQKNSIRTYSNWKDSQQL